MKTGDVNHAKELMGENGKRTETVKGTRSKSRLPAVVTHKIQIKRPTVGEVLFEIKGLSPYMSHCWSEKAMKQIIDKGARGGKAHEKPLREKRDPKAEFFASMYPWPGGGYGMRAASFRKAAIAACRHVDGLTMTAAFGLFYCPESLIKIIAPKPKMSTEMVRVANGQPDIRYRGIWETWATKVLFRYNANAIDPEQIANLLMTAGEFVGVGEWRVEKGGTYGRFTLAGF